MPEEFLLLEHVKLDIRGFESRRALQNVSPVDWFCPSGRKKNGTRNRVRERFYSDIRYHSAKRECFGTSRRAMQKQALPENGYRVIPNSAKRFLPHYAGGSQIFSRCFCMSDDETTLLPLRRITYYEKDDYQ